ncbi:DUF5343 domain-containing protein [Aromatoleum evansii]|uniref:DUF5343 domain-containing protein n=1 Tax=Aromatoleum evansii TaxID=59406 RepID=UPI00145F90CE|nr:DUF5343 domain-containing protein [Aromatoleum evansii]NMG31895.1 hypothetical protein [Aromatoleum evansii]
MSLTNAYVQIYGQLPEVFARISDGAAPDKFTTQHLKDWGYASSNYRAVIPLLKALGFLSSDGSPTSRYHEYRNTANSKRIMGEAIREAYSDLFTIKAKPSNGDRQLIEGKFKSTHNASPTTAKLMANTFYALLDLADLSESPEPKSEAKIALKPAESQPSVIATEIQSKGHGRPSLHYNIQIHLPATKDIEVFNAIFKSLKEHLLD